jgi:hypothetical protein
MPILVLLNSFPSHASDKKMDHTERRKYNLFLDLTYNSSSIKGTGTTTSSTTTSSQIVAAEFGGDYFLIPKLALTAEMLLTLVSSINAGIKGYDLGARYYPYRSGHEHEANLLSSLVESTPGFAPFIYSGFSVRQFSFANSDITFQGYELGVGADFHFEHEYFLRSGINYQSLQNSSARIFTGLVTSLAFGYSF